MTLSKAALLSLFALFALFIGMLATNVGIVSADEVKSDVEGQPADYAIPENGLLQK